jgi:hypothetical protein
MPWRAGERVVETMPVGFMSVDANWQITYVNPAGVDQSQEQLVGADYWTASRPMPTTSSAAPTGTPSPRAGRSAWRGRLAR